MYYIVLTIRPIYTWYLIPGTCENQAKDRAKNMPGTWYIPIHTRRYTDAAATCVRKAALLELYRIVLLAPCSYQSVSETIMRHFLERRKHAACNVGCLPYFSIHTVYCCTGCGGCCSATAALLFWGRTLPSSSPLTSFISTL